MENYYLLLLETEKYKYLCKFKERKGISWNQYKGSGKVWKVYIKSNKIIKRTVLACGSLNLIKKFSYIYSNIYKLTEDFSLNKKLGFLNMKPENGIDGGNTIFTEEARIRKYNKMSKNLKGKNLGKKRSPEVVELLRKQAKGNTNRRGKKSDPKSVEKMRATKLSQNLTAEKSSNYIGEIEATEIKTGKVTILKGNVDMFEKGFNPGHVCACLKGKRNKHKKHTFKRKI